MSEFMTNGATIALGAKVIAKSGAVVTIREGHIGLQKENGDLIASGPVSELVIKKSMMYFAMPTLLLTVDGQKFRVNLCYEAVINAGMDDAAAKDKQRELNEEFFAAVQAAGGKV